MRGPRQAERSTEAATGSLAVNRAYPFGRPSALALVAMLLLCGTMMAVSPWVAHAAVIRACYNRANGALRWVAPRGHCRRGEAQISWNLAGPAGQKGPLGPAGFQGVQGVAGATGPAGKAGATGSAAMSGLTGPTGVEVAGAPGAAGAAGATGEASTEKGGTGMTGAVGVPGATGATGPTGPSEGAGTTGPTGPSGPGLPATLASGASETGVWIVTTPHAAELAPWLSADNIVFQVPLAANIKNPPAGCQEVPSKAECHAKQLSLKETQEVAAGKLKMPGCTEKEDPKLLQEPVAEPGNFCAYTGVEEFSVPAAGRQGVINPVGEAGASRTGAVIAYASETAPSEGVVRAQGSWAVKG